MLENASLQNKLIRLLEREDFLPFRRVLEVSADAKGRAPVEIVRGIVTVSKYGRDRDDALVSVVGKGHKNVDNAWCGLGGSVPGE